jgi:glycopeptide antibiotics resistance protein
LALRITLAVYLFALALIAFWPVPVDGAAKGTLDIITAWCATHGLGIITYAHIESTANVLLFVPLGMLLTLLLRPSRFWMPPLICFAASVFIELSQGALLAHRFASLGDVIANTIGGLVGTAIALATRRSPASPERPTSAIDI